jgi:hypothetical protein
VSADQGSDTSVCARTGLKRLQSAGDQMLGGGDDDVAGVVLADPERAGQRVLICPRQGELDGGPDGLSGVSKIATLSGRPMAAHLCGCSRATTRAGNCAASPSASGDGPPPAEGDEIMSMDSCAWPELSPGRGPGRAAWQGLSFRGTLADVTGYPLCSLFRPWGCATAPTGSTRSPPPALDMGLAGRSLQQAHCGRGHPSQAAGGVSGRRGGHRPPLSPDWRVERAVGQLRYFGTCRPRRTRCALSLPPAAMPQGATAGAEERAWVIRRAARISPAYGG